MLSIRFQRTGRRGQAKFRVVVQDSRRSPTSGRVVANLGHYDPHSKDHGVDFDRLVVYLKNGAQPSSRVAHLLTTNKIELPGWVKVRDPHQRSIRHPEKLRRNRPEETAGSDKPAAESPPDETSGDEPVAETDKSDQADDQPVAADTPQETPADSESGSDKDQTPKEAADKSVASDQAPVESEDEDKKEAAGQPPADDKDDKDDSANDQTQKSE